MKNSNRPNLRGSLLLDFMMAFSIGLLFTNFIYTINSQTRLLLNKAEDSIDFISNYQVLKGQVSSQNLQSISSSSFIMAKKSYGNYFIQNYFLSTSSDHLLNEIFTNIQVEKSDGKDLCNPLIHEEYPIGSYEDYKDLTSNGTSTYGISIRNINIPISVDNIPTDFLVRSGIAYISLDSNIQNDPDIIVIDIRGEPKILSSLNTGPGISSLAFVGDRIFASVLSTTNQVQIIDLDNNRKLSLVTKYKLPLPYATATPPLGSSISFNYPYIYLGTNKWDGDEFNILSLTGNSLTRNSGFEVGSKVNFIDYDAKSIYLSGSNQNQLLRLDYEGSSILQSERFGPSGYERQEGKVTHIFEDSLYFGRTSGGFDLPNDHEIFSFPHTLADTKFDNPYSINITGGIYGIVADKNSLFAITRIPNSELLVFDRNLHTIQNVSLPISPKALHCDMDKLYVLANNAPFISEITIKK